MTPKRRDRIVRVTVNRKALIHAIADCKVCGAHWDDYLTTQKLAAAHSRRTGHTVIADLGYTVQYGTNVASRKGKKR